MTETFHMTRSMRIGSTILTALLRAGLPFGSLTLLSVRGRKSGKVYTTPVALVERSGTRWLVAAFGEVNWVRNLRTAGQAQLTRGRRTEAIGVVELEAQEAAPILKQFLTSYQTVPFIPPYFVSPPSQTPRKSSTRSSGSSLRCAQRCLQKIVKIDGGPCGRQPLRSTL